MVDEKDYISKEEDYLSILIKVIIVFFVLSLIVGLARSEILLIPIHQEQIKKFARLSSYLSATLSVIYIVAVLCIIFVVTWLAMKLFSFELRLSTYLEAITITFGIFIYKEIAKLFLLYFLLYKEVQHITYRNFDNVKLQIANLTFSHAIHYLRLAFIILAIAGFAYSLRDQEVKNKVVLASSSITLILLIIFIFLL